MSKRKLLFGSVVILRAFRDEPLRRMGLKCPDGTIIVQKEGSRPNDFIGWRREDVFIFDAEEYERLRAAFETESKEELADAWAQQQVAYA